MEVGKQFRKIHMTHTAHTAHTTLIHPIFVFAHIVPLAPLRVREHSVRLDNKLELLFVAALLSSRHVSWTGGKERVYHIPYPDDVSSSPVYKLS